MGKKAMKPAGTDIKTKTHEKTGIAEKISIATMMAAAIFLLAGLVVLKISSNLSDEINESTVTNSVTTTNSIEPSGLAGMLAFDRLPYIKPGVSAGQFSSHDLTGGNDDGSADGVLAIESGGILSFKYTLFASTRPGCIQRIWFTGLSSGNIQFYFNGETNPRINMNVYDFFSGNTYPFIYPLAGNSSVSSGGYYNYYPICYSSGLKIKTTFNPQYFNITYHNYTSNEELTTYSNPGENPTAVNQMWLLSGQDPKNTAGNTISTGQINIAPGQTGTLLQLNNPGSIQSIKLSSVYDTGALNKAKLRMFWDGAQPAAVEATVGEFFGSGLGRTKVKSLPIGMDLPKFEASSLWNGWFAPNDEIPATGDFNGDGKDDIVTFVGNGEVYVGLSTGTSFSTGTKWHQSFFNTGEYPGVGDFNGDGKDDIATFAANGKIWVSLSTGNGFGTSSVWLTDINLNGKTPRIGDFNGDGKDDIAITDTDGAGQVRTALSDGTKFTSLSIWYASDFPWSQNGVAGDFNGDGKDDLAEFSNGKINVSLSTGLGFASPTLWHGNFYNNTGEIRAGDFNGDSKDDLANFKGDRKVYVTLSNGTSFRGTDDVWNDNFYVTGEVPGTGDFDGNGMDDIVTFVSNSTGNVYASLTKIKDTSYYAYFPMPFWSSALIQVANTSASDPIELSYEIQHSSKAYDGDAGYFKTQSQSKDLVADGKDYTVLQADGTGHYVGSVITMEGPLDRSYLEGDERIYVDGSLSPAIYGTGTEDYFNGGWYFENGVFNLPVHGNPARVTDTKDKTACYRMHLSDFVPFTSSIKVGLEYGPNNDVSAHYSSIAYYYHRSEKTGVLTDSIDVGNSASETAHQYLLTGLNASGTRTLNYEGDDDEVSLSDDFKAFKGYSQFHVTIDSDNIGVRLRRRIDQCVADQKANVYVDDSYVGTWYTAGQNCSKRWLDSDFNIPATYTKGKSSIKVKIIFVSSSNDWNEFRYWIYSMKSIPVIGTLETCESKGGSCINPKTTCASDPALVGYYPTELYYCSNDYNCCLKSSDSSAQN